MVAVTFEEVLIFITGADTTPPCGFSSKLVIEFYSNDSGCSRIPFASTCSLTLSLPRGMNNPDIFRAIIVRALKESHGFWQDIDVKFFGVFYILCTNKTPYFDTHPTPLLHLVHFQTHHVYVWSSYQPVPLCLCMISLSTCPLMSMYDLPIPTHYYKCIVTSCILDSLHFLH